MKLQKTGRVAVLTLALLALGATLASAQMGPPQPTEHHKYFEHAVGTWKAKISMMGTTSEGTEVNSLVCGGLWMKSEFKSTMMGMAFEGMGLYGYDPTKKKYVGVWVDNMSTNYTPSEGNLEDDGKTMVQWAMMPDMSGHKMVKTKMTDRYVDDDHRVLVFSQAGADGKDVETMRIEYTRVKK